MTVAKNSILFVATVRDGDIATCVHTILLQNPFVVVFLLPLLFIIYSPGFKFIDSTWILNIWLIILSVRAEIIINSKESVMALFNVRIKLL